MLDPLRQQRKGILAECRRQIVLLADRAAESLQDLLLHLRVAAAERTGHGLGVTVYRIHGKADLFALVQLLFRAVELFDEFLAVRKIRVGVRVGDLQHLLIHFPKLLIILRERVLRLLRTLSELFRASELCL